MTLNELTMSTDLKKKFNHIYNYERAIGSSVALRVIQSKPIGVWEFLIPIVFILHFMRNKQSRELFIQNYMFTKRHALDAAFKMLKKGLSREDVLSGVADKTRALLTAPETQGIYSDTIRQQQMCEIELLFDHYASFWGLGAKIMMPWCAMPTAAGRTTLYFTNN